MPMNIEELRTHDNRNDIEITLRTGIMRDGDDEVPGWFADAEDYRTCAGDSPEEALSVMGELIEKDGDVDKTTAEVRR